MPADAFKTEEYNDWHHGLCGCFDDMQVCISAFLCPCATFGTNAEITGVGGCVPCALAFYVPILNCMMALKIRQKLRAARNIPGTTVSDVMTILCCPLLALVQEAQECKSHDPAAMSMSRE